VLARLADNARRLRVPAVVVLFEPQPLEFFHAGPARLMRLREKIEALRHYPVDRVVCARFDARLAGLAPQAFIDRILVRSLGVRYLVVGDDFRFGKDRAGDFAMLRDAAGRNGFEVASQPTVTVDGGRVSSTRIRAALKIGDLATAAKLLGRPYQMSGRVVHGSKLGRRLGIPTANIRPRRATVPLQGIYVAELHGVGPGPIPGAASIGTRPTVAGREPMLEIHLLDFDRDIYRRQVTVTFLKKLRDEMRFDSVDEMARHIREDVARTREFFQSGGAGGPVRRNALNE